MIMNSHSKIKWYIGALIIQLLVFNAYAQDDDKWAGEIDAFSKLDSISAPPASGLVLFTGSSSIRMWQNPQSDFNNDKIINRGFGGSQIIDLIENFDQIIFKYKPERIVIYAGDNDVAAGKSADQVYGDFCTLYGMVKAKLPHSKLIYIAIKPSLARWYLWTEMLQANTKINGFLADKENAWFVDIYSPMIGLDGKPDNKYFIDDGLHMTKAGYELWTAVLSPYLVK